MLFQQSIYGYCNLLPHQLRLVCQIPHNSARLWIIGIPEIIGVSLPTTNASFNNCYIHKAISIVAFTLLAEVMGVSVPPPDPWGCQKLNTLLPPNWCLSKTFPTTTFIQSTLHTCTLKFCYWTLLQLWDSLLHYLIHTPWFSPNNWGARYSTQHCSVVHCPV